MAYTSLILESFDDSTWEDRFVGRTGATTVDGPMGIGKAYTHTDVNNGLRLETTNTTNVFNREYTVGMRINRIANGTVLSGNDYVGTGNFARHFRLNVGNGTLELYLADSASSQGNLATTLDVPTGWYHVEFQIIGSSAATGTARIYINGNLRYENTAIRTDNTTNNAAMQISVGAAYAYIDDLYVMDSADPADRLGPVFIETLRPNNDGFHTEWTGGDYTDVNEDPPNDENYLTGGSGDRVTFQFPNTQREIDTVKVVELQTRVGGLGDVTPLIRSGEGTDTLVGDPITTGGDFANFRFLMEENPETESPWEPEEANGYEFGLQVT